MIDERIAELLHRVGALTAEQADELRKLIQEANEQQFFGSVPMKQT